MIVDALMCRYSDSGNNGHVTHCTVVVNELLRGGAQKRKALRSRTKKAQRSQYSPSSSALSILGLFEKVTTFGCADRMLSDGVP